MTPADWPTVRAIYEAGIATGNATFETAAPTYEAWDASHLASPRLVATDAEGEVVGWAALAPISGRAAYAGVAENSVYVRTDRQGFGIGSRLLGDLVATSEQAGIWTLQTAIFPENAASLAIHERCGFRIVGRRERIGQIHDVWRDTLFLERRSATVGC